MTVGNNTSIGASFEPVKAGKKASHVVFVLDESSSMGMCRDTTISGYNEYLETQKQDSKESGIETFVSLYKFNGNDVINVIDRKSIEDVESLTTSQYTPNGMTNLYDAVGSVMATINKDLSSKKKKNRDSIIITILTDGGENASRSFNNKDVKMMVEKAEGKNWGFMFLGANINAFDVGSVMGFKAENTIQYETTSMGATMRTASAMTSRLKHSYDTGVATADAYVSNAFTPEERMSVVGDKDA